VRFKAIRIGPRELTAKLMELAETQESLQAELDVSTAETGSMLRIEIHNGRLSARKIRPEK
jgi:hypothetical protein